jgi:hypothetical protein
VAGHDGADRKRRHRSVGRSQRGRHQHRRVLRRDGWFDAGGRQTDARGIAGPSRSRADGGILPSAAALLPLRVATAAQGRPRTATVVRVRNGGGSGATFHALPVRGDPPPYTQPGSPKSCQTDARPNTSASSRRWVLCFPIAGPEHCCRNSCHSRMSPRWRQPDAGPRVWAPVALQPITRIAPFPAIIAFYVENFNRRLLHQTAMKWD